MHNGGVTYIESGGTEPITVQVFNKFTNTPLTGKTDIKVQIRRIKDDKYLDWSDNELKPYASVTQLLEVLTEIPNNPGLYRLNTTDHVRGLDTSEITNAETDDIYDIVITQDTGTDAGGLPIGFQLKVGHFLDTILRIVALQKENYFIDQMTYNTRGLMTSARIRLFANKAATLAATDGGSGEGEFETYSFTSSPNATQTERADNVRSVKD